MSTTQPQPSLHNLETKGVSSMPSRIRDKRSEKRSRMRLRGAAISTFALMLSYGVTPSHCFGSNVVGRRFSTRRHFRNTVDGAFRGTEVATNVGTAYFAPTAVPPMPPPMPPPMTPPPMPPPPTPSGEVTTHGEETMPPVGKLPIWLRNQQSHLHEENWNLLREAMTKSFFTESETLKLRVAINKASGGDRHKMAGAAEFCLILVESMEMGLNALIASVFHYCSCVTARERIVQLPPGASSSVWEHHDHDGIEEFGKRAWVIATDAGNLKKLEMVANTVMNSGELQGQRVTPDSNDSENLKNLLLVETKDWRALAIRSAAALYRLRGIIKSGSLDLTNESRRASREALHIYAPLASRLGMHRLKNELEGAAFRILYRRQYGTVNALARQERSQDGGHISPSSVGAVGGSFTSVYIADIMKHILATVKEEMTEMLENDEEFSSLVRSFSVSARVKEPYSMWKKMLKNGSKHITEVPDAVALRIVLDARKLTEDEPDQVTRARERALCYYARKLCKQRWKPMEGNPRFKDYIERPKPNGYQSLHYTATTAWGGEDWSLEIQVRSGEMHKVAEFGLASHWDYKAQKAKKPFGERIMILDHSTDAYLRSLQEWHWQQRGGGMENDGSPTATESVFSEITSTIRADRIRERTKQLKPYLDALTAARSDLTRENVFVFVSQHESTEGKVLSLPAGACVLDALREAERQFGVSIPWNEDRSLVSCNGSSAIVTAKLTNGDVLKVNGSRGDFQ